jgi:hypothetical protein
MMNDRTMKTATRLSRRRALAGGLVGLLALGGCANVVIEGGAANWAEATLAAADVVPANTDPSRRTRVVVLPSDDSPSAKGAGLAAVASAGLESILGAGGVEVVERNLAGRLDQELKLAELKGSGTYGGPDVADYAIRVVMGTAGWSSTYVQPTSYTNPKTNQTTTTPGGYTHKGTSSMTLRIYALPSLKLVESFPVEGSVSNALQPAAAGPANANGLMRSATEGGIKSKRSQVLNEFAPKGYITERRTKGKQSIFRVQLGKNTGTKMGDTVEIWTIQKVGSSLDEVSLGKGRMSNIVGNEGSWILVDDEKVAARVRKFDFVKVKVGGLFDGLGGLGNLLQQ